MSELALVLMLQMLLGAFQFAALKAYSSRKAFGLIMVILVANFCLTGVILFGGLIWDWIQAFQIDPEFFYREDDSFDFLFCIVTSLLISGVTTVFSVLFSTSSYRERGDD